eukprot:TRINITY_DN38726_c0_g1_i1.p1 TRINITY_DN38726_c0_g1~~TRINITY_DN38726_c0_g1_i1.p1  ORF type:complete len:608 (+),score=94.63 TRINITY_DN38726_c0_g1_i1:275-2098(+)
MSDVEEGRNLTGAAEHGGTYDLTVESLNYKVMKKNKDKQLEETYLLSNISARARHGQILAVVGPSGAGKSTFLDAVAGRINPASLEGAILVNGKPVDSSFKRFSGYVMQDDALFPMLTVRETLLFSARLRLPNTMSFAEKKERVEGLIQELGLSSCADTAIGNAEVRGVSGGERRRVSIGVDLIHDPPVLFLDEPTSGLDSTSALSVVQILNGIAEERKRTVVLTIHQPSFRILELIHNFLILARGQVIYHGPYPGLVGYFRDYGRDVPDHVNTLEYALDVIEEEQNSDGGLAPLVKFYEGRAQHAKAQLSMSSNLGVVTARDFATSFVSETLTLMDRNFKNVSRTPELFGGRVGLMCVTGLVLGSLFFDSKYNPKGVQQRTSFFSFALALLIFTSTEALPIFLDERQIFIRETSRGAYRGSSYVVSGAVVFLPFLFILALIFSCISYFMVGLIHDTTAFFMFVCTLFLTLCVANSYVTFFGGFVPNFILGNTLVTATTAFFFLFSGFFLPRKDIPKYWIWLHYMSTFKYPLEALITNEFGKLEDKCWDGKHDTLAGCTNTSDDVMRSFSAGAVHLWENACIQVLFFLGYRFFFFLMLKLQTAKVRK